MTDKKDVSIGLRNLRIHDYIELKSSMIKAYPNWEGAYWKEHHIASLLDRFPEGQICVTVNDRVVASALTIIVSYDLYGDNHTYADITGNYTFSTHDNNGDYLYGIEIFVHPDYREMRLGRRMYDARKDLCEKMNLKGIIAGGRIPNYSEHSDKMSPKEFIEKVQHKELYDPILTFQLSNDFHVRRILKGYMPDDKESMEYAVLIEWTNVYYQDKPRLINQPKSVVRIGLVQWQMRHFSDMDKLFEQVEFFIDAVSGYKSDFVLFPEFFNAPLMADYNHLPESEAIRKLAVYTEPSRKRFSELAVAYNINVISGSMPFIENDQLKNVGFLCRRDGSFERYEKIHITPSELTFWGMVGGNDIRVFDTDCGKIGVLICYDVEFPELPRLMADQGMNLLFVPFLTDTQNGYMRVRRCAQARAIENECYVSIAGCVGNLPRVNNMDIQYAQSAVFTPSDFAFPTNGVKTEATPNTAMTLIVDV
ncbi:MAG: carbon-nitrogen hydrolase, partial [Bacteroidales bacterium]|nr:carbon-nitrogen hydrolase [Bacteroidales bacterium]